MTFMLDGKQYVVVVGGPTQAAGAGGRGGGRGQAPDGPARPSHLLAFALDGKATLPQ